MALVFWEQAVNDLSARDPMMHRIIPSILVMPGMILPGVGGGIGFDPVDDLALVIDIDRQLVAEVALAGLLRPGRVGILLAPCRRLPVECLG
ncbi:hypothetical protein C8R14_10846 [Nitrosomonas eutropha]|uniref:Uncharacterized protein n=1 Tax=Nitrosomonas eutropha TaxID=916 RepID=A0ABX5M7X6_9PROT|nr:hypothetical protein C8R14_10846 [Nitrosomonas eutropha]SEI68271.1 hypothetical protein SAMN05216318_10850 [Nitrosomonas eutropha]